eukprot:m.23228 g.23228  ORF g.23228 m.23228 type:complete len:217 (-) comp7476_c0_seq2:124-774(-)
MTNMDDKAEDHVTDVSAPVAFDDVFATLEPIQEEHKGTVQPLRQPRGVLVPPLNFGIVAPGVYRSGYPNKKNTNFLKRLRLKTIVYLCPEPYREENQQFVDENNIDVRQVNIEEQFLPTSEIEYQKMHEALSHIVDERNHPLLIHCNKGNHRTGCVVGCLRRLMRWSLTAITDEYSRFTGNNPRFLDLEYIELYEMSLEHEQHLPAWLSAFYSNKN